MSEGALTSFTVTHIAVLRVRHSYRGQKLGHAQNIYTNRLYLIWRKSRISLDDCWFKWKSQISWIRPDSITKAATHSQTRGHPQNCQHSHPQRKKNISRMMRYWWRRRCRWTATGNDLRNEGLMTERWDKTLISRRWHTDARTSCDEAVEFAMRRNSSAPPPVNQSINQSTKNYIAPPTDQKRRRFTT